MKLNNILIGLSTITILGLVGCGGGSTENPPAGNTITQKYAGSITPGDFITISRSGSRVEYNITGSVFSSITGNIDISEVPDSSGYLFRDAAGGEAGFLFAGDLTLASLPIAGKTHMAIGLRESEKDLTVSDIVGVYAYTEANFEADGSFEGALNCQVTIDANHTAIAQCVGNPDGILRWDFSSDRSHVLVRASDLARPVTHADAHASIVIKTTTGAGERKSFILDKNGGHGFAIALEKHPITQADVTGEYLVIDFKWDEISTIAIIADPTDPTLLHTTMRGMDVGRIHINQDCDARLVSGISCIIDNEGKAYTGMIDTESGYVFAAANDSSSDESNFIIGIKLPVAAP